MAKAKKQEKPIEQRLEEALVLYEKTPYDLPSNWCWTTFEPIANLYTGNSINEREKELKYTGLSEGYNYIATKDIGFDYEIEYENGIKIPYEATRFKKARKGASLLCIEGGSAGRKIGFLQEEVCFVNKLCCFDFHGLVDKLYFYYLQSNEFFNLFNANKVGLIGGVSVNNLKQIAVPLAPLEEQKRIVEIIDKQFAKLDEARDLIQKSLDSFADRKSVILHKAFTGKLTKQWRSDNQKKKNNCVKLGTVVMLMNGDRGINYPSKNDYVDVGIPFINAGALKNGKVDIEECNFITEDKFDALRAGKVMRNDVLYCLRGSLGKTAFLDNIEKGAISSSLCILRSGNQINPKFLFYLMNSDIIINQQIMADNGSAQPNLSAKSVNNYKIDLPCLEEQEEIVRILDSIFEKEDKSKELIDMLDKIDEMKKSILARAFRGELGTSNPTDEPASDLLRKILAQSN